MTWLDWLIFTLFGIASIVLVMIITYELVRFL